MTALHEFGIEFSAMASRCEIRVCAADEARARAWAEAAIAEVRRIEAKYSRYRADSVVARINAAAGGAAVEVDAETAALLDFGARLYELSGGLFDPTSGVLRRAWDFAAQRVPRQDEIDALLPLIGWRQVEWRRPYLRLTRAGMEIDFGGIGKEYAADRAAAAMESHGARRGFVNLGGDVRAFGPQPDGRPWSIGIQHPRAASGVTIGAIELARGAVATSGDYERCFERDGRRFCHILDPRTGWPVTHWQSVSVAAPVCAAAGACTTIAMLKPVDEALAFLRGQQVQFLAVAADGELFQD
ncbi:MAG TPA: FAD:protein FMN transferase [Burkholderiaceae bacterium]|nr:FAD:protein FMN transferase [Burkholderiaceae bacterium]